MHMYFSKLNKNLSVTIDDFKKEDYLISYGKNIRYFKTALLRTDITEVLPERHRKYFMPLVMEVYNNLAPHIDDGVRASLNFYVTPANCITQFYDVVEDKPVRILGSGGGKTFTKDCLKQTESFIAQQGDIWLLNVSKPHSVESLNEKPATRLAICLQSHRFDYDQVAEMLIETGYL
jgi:hypothetical protein